MISNRKTPRNDDITIRRYEKKDWKAIWDIIRPVFSEGETYYYPRDISESMAHDAWITAPEETFVAVGKEGEILGTYYIKPNHPGLGDHICNCGYIVATTARGRGIAKRMCIHSLREGARRKYVAMQFNFVVSTNMGAVRLWKSLGFSVIGTIPKAFRHSKEGLVDALVMYRELGAEVEYD